MTKSPLHMKILIVLVMIAAASIQPASLAGGADCRTAMALLDEAVLGISSWEGNFMHSVYFSAESYTEVEEGKLYTEKGGKMRWEYTAPKGKLAVSDGKTVWLYLPDEKRAYKLKIPPQKYLPVPMRLLFGKTRPSREFFCAAAESDKGMLTIELGFKEKNVNFRRLSVSLDEKEKFIAGISYIDELDNQIVFTFRGGKKNGKTDPVLFSFTPPPGTKISEELGDLDPSGQF